MHWISLAVTVAAFLAMLTTWAIYARARTGRRGRSEGSPDSPLDPDKLRLMDEDQLPTTADGPEELQTVECG